MGKHIDGLVVDQFAQAFGKGGACFGKYLTADAIGHRFGIVRSTVHSTIRELKKLGWKVETDNAGLAMYYKLTPPVDKPVEQG